MMKRLSPQKWRKSVDRAPQKPAAVSPISKERLDWVVARLTTIDGARRDLMQYKAWYVQALQCPHDVMVQAMAALKVEEVQLMAEKRFLESVLENK